MNFRKHFCQKIGKAFLDYLYNIDRLKMAFRTFDFLGPIFIILTNKSVDFPSHIQISKSHMRVHMCIHVCASRASRAHAAVHYAHTQPCADLRTRSPERARPFNIGQNSNNKSAPNLQLLQPAPGLLKPQLQIELQPRFVSFGPSRHEITSMDQPNRPQQL